MDPCHICILPEPARPTVADAKLTLQAQAGMIGRGEEEVQSFVRGIIYMQRKLSLSEVDSVLEICNISKQKTPKITSKLLRFYSTPSIRMSAYTEV